MLPCKEVDCCTTVNLPTIMDVLISASPDSRSLVMVALRYVFSRRNVLNDRSHSSEVIGNVHKMRSNLCTYGENI